MWGRYGFLESDGADWCAVDLHVTAQNHKGRKMS